MDFDATNESGHITAPDPIRAKYTNEQMHKQTNGKLGQPKTVMPPLTLSVGEGIIKPTVAVWLATGDDSEAGILSRQTDADKQECDIHVQT